MVINRKQLQVVVESVSESLRITKIQLANMSQSQIVTMTVLIESITLLLVATVYLPCRLIVGVSPFTLVVEARYPTATLENRSSSTKIGHQTTNKDAIDLRTTLLDDNTLFVRTTMMELAALTTLLTTTEIMYVTTPTTLFIRTTLASATELTVITMYMAKKGRKLPVAILAKIP